MRTSKKRMISLISLMILAISVSIVQARDQEDWEEQDATLVGRISHLEGQLSRYNSSTDDWEVTTKEAPFGLDDLLYADVHTKAEFVLPNNTWIRIGGDTRLQLITLEPDTTALDLAYGKARLYNKSTRTQINATTPFGQLTVPPGATIDLSVDENRAEIIAIKKKGYFIHNSSSDRHEIRANSSAILADINLVAAAPGKIEYDWKKWNQKLDEIWAARMRSKGVSTEHLPAELHTEAYPLDQHGVWEKVYYDGAHYRFWRPVHVHTGWAPFTSGTWSVWHGDHVWIPHEPFGYVTHHYGNWIFTSGFWYWAPPVTRVTVRTRVSHLRIGFGWYPGRVAWIHHGAHLGWIPLAPYEPYYTHRRWGRRSIVVTDGLRYHRRHHRYKHHKHAVVIHRSHLYRSENYRRSRIKNIPHRTIRENFRSSPVVRRAVIKDYGSHKMVNHRNRAAHRARLSNPPAKRLSNNDSRRLDSSATRYRAQKKQLSSTRKTIDGRRDFSAKPNTKKIINKTPRRTAPKDRIKQRPENASKRRTPAMTRTQRSPKRDMLHKDRGGKPSRRQYKSPPSSRTKMGERKTPINRSAPDRKHHLNRKMQGQKSKTTPYHRNPKQLNRPTIPKKHLNTKQGVAVKKEQTRRQHRYDEIKTPSNPKRTHYRQSPDRQKRSGNVRKPSYTPQRSSRFETSTKSYQERQQPVQRQMRQQNHRSRSQTIKPSTGSRQRHSSTGGSRQQRRY